MVLYSSEVFFAMIVGMYLFKVIESFNREIVDAIANRYFFVQFAKDELFIDQTTIEKVKKFIANAKKKYPNHKIKLMALDPQEQLSLTMNRQITLGRVISVRSLLKKIKYKNKQIMMRLSEKPPIPENLNIENGVVVIEIIK